MIQPRKTYRQFAIPAILVAALISLAALQIIWLKELSDGQRERMKENVEIGAARFAEELNNTLRSMHSEFQFMSTSIDSIDAVIGSVQRLWSEWENTTAYPGLIERILVQTNATQDPHLVAIVPSGDAVIHRPSDHIINLLAHKPTNDLTESSHDLSTVFDDESLILVHVIDPVVLTLDNRALMNNNVSSEDLNKIDASTINRISISRVQSVAGQPDIASPTKLILMIDSDYLKDTVIPELTAKHLMYDGSLDYTISIAQVDSTKSIIFYGDTAQAETIEDADVILPITRPKELSFVVLRAGPSIFVRNNESQSAQPPPFDDLRMSINQTSDEPSESPAWNLYVRHNLGSIDAAANAFRRNSSLLSLGILSILGIGFILIYRNNSKANELARQQMEFVAGVSHELRTPLSVIRSAGDNMTAGLITDVEGARRYGRLIHSESIRLNDLIEQVLEFSGIQSGQRHYEYKPQQLHRLVLNSLKGLEERVDPEHVSINISFDRCPPIMADASSLISVIQNVVINAVKYNGEHPIIDIEVYNAFDGGKPRVCIDIADNGQGIDPDELDTIFEPFYRARGIRDQQVKGNGLGLSIVKSVMQQHDGSVSVSSKLGVGSTFTLTFKWLDLPINNA